MKFWLDVDGALVRTAAALADPIQKALTASVDVEDVLSQWERTYPEGTDITRLEGRQWARNTITVDEKPLLNVLGDVYATGYVFGDLVATAAYGHETLKTKAGDPKPPNPDQVQIAINVDWSNWVPGNKPAAALMRPKAVLNRLLASRKTLVDGLRNTTVEHFGNILANGLAAGTDRYTLAAQLAKYLENPSRALMIATTELTRGMQTTALEQFKEFGATVKWLALDPCDVCAGNAGDGVVEPGHGFRDVNGDTIYNPPAHPHCRCALTPVVDLNPDIPSLDLALQAAMVKYSENQARDYHGRFASGAGSLEEELTNWNPNNPIPEAGKNGAGMTAKAWDAWEHGVDGTQYIDLMRKQACGMTGLPIPKTDFDEGGSLHYMMQRGWGAPNENTTAGMVDSIANSGKQPELWRGLSISDPAYADVIANLKPGDSMDMPLSSFTRSIGVAQWYANDRATGTPVLFHVEQGANGVSVKPSQSFYPLDYETVVNGKFEVVSTETVSAPYWKRTSTRIDSPNQDFATPNMANYNQAPVGQATVTGIFDAIKENPAADLSKFNTKDTIFHSKNEFSYGSAYIHQWDRQPAKPIKVVTLRQKAVYKRG